MRRFFTQVNYIMKQKHKMNVSTWEEFTDDIAIKSSLIKPSKNNGDVYESYSNGA